MTAPSALAPLWQMQQGSHGQAQGEQGPGEDPPTAQRASTPVWQALGDGQSHMLAGQLGATPGQAVGAPSVLLAPAMAAATETPTRAQAQVQGQQAAAAAGEPGLPQSLGCSRASRRAIMQAHSDGGLCVVRPRHLNYWPSLPLPPPPFPGLHSKTDAAAAAAAPRGMGPEGQQHQLLQLQAQSQAQQQFASPTSILSEMPAAVAGALAALPGAAVSHELAGQASEASAAYQCGDYDRAVQLCQAVSGDPWRLPAAAACKPAGVQRSGSIKALINKLTTCVRCCVVLCSCILRATRGAPTCCCSWVLRTTSWGSTTAVSPSTTSAFCWTPGWQRWVGGG